MKKMYRLNVQQQQAQQQQQQQQQQSTSQTSAVALTTTQSHIIIQQHPNVSNAHSNSTTHILGGIPAGGGNGPGIKNSAANVIGSTTITAASPIALTTNNKLITGNGHLNGEGSQQSQPLPPSTSSHSSTSSSSKIIVTSIKSEPIQDVITITPANAVTVVSNIVNNIGNSIGSTGSVSVNSITAPTVTVVASGSGGGGGSTNNAQTIINNTITSSLNSSTNLTTIASTSTGSTNGHNIVYVPNKRAKLDGHDDWISSPSPSAASSAAPLSPSPGSQSHNFNTNISNGYPSPMSTGSYDAYSPNGKMGREDLSPSSSLNGYGNDGCDPKKSKKGPTPRMQEELCLVCGDRASGYHYNALTCEGCKGFFRRSVTKNAVYCCKFGHACEMDMYMRRKCQECRLKKCLAVGMRPECVVPENQCAMKRKEKKAQKEKDKGGGGGIGLGGGGGIGTGPGSIGGNGIGGNGAQIASAVSTTNTLKNEILQLMKCDPPHPGCMQLLPEKLLAENRARNIPPLTSNQLYVIYKLIWYQDGYEQPSEEDLKRIMISSPDENESQHDISFRHITEITILTVQLIVEFAKGLPAFTKIPQEDQITLLKACSSEVMMLRMARRYDAASDSIYFANNRSYTRDSYKMAGMADNIEDLLHFCRRMYSMTVDNVEYALLTAIVIFSDRPGLEEAELVEAIQSYYIDTLRVYILNRHGGDPKCLVFFAKLLSILTELRTLGNQNAEMCFSLKLKNRKLPRFLEEIWDVHAIPPSVQSHIQATQEQQQQQQMAAAAAAAAQNGGIGIIGNTGLVSGNIVGSVSGAGGGGGGGGGSTSSNNSNSGMISDDGENSSSRGATNIGVGFVGGTTTTTTTNLTAA